jgi:hypothetical protein
MVLRNGIRLEMHGLKRHGRSCYSIVKREFGLTGTRERVLQQLEEKINEWNTSSTAENGNPPVGQGRDSEQLEGVGQS